MKAKSGCRQVPASIAQSVERLSCKQVKRVRFLLLAWAWNQGWGRSPIQRTRCPHVTPIMTAARSTSASKPKEKDKNEGLREYRIESIENLGFSKREAKALGSSTIGMYTYNNGSSHRYDMPLTHHEIRKHMSQGASIDQILRIFT